MKSQILNKCGSYYYISICDGNRVWSFSHLSKIDWNEDKTSDLKNNSNIVGVSFKRNDTTQVILFECEVFARRMIEILDELGFIPDKTKVFVQAIKPPQFMKQSNIVYTYHDMYYDEKTGNMFFERKE